MIVWLEEIAAQRFWVPWGPSYPGVSMWAGYRHLVGYDESVISPAFSTTHGLSDPKILQISPSCNDIVDQMPVLRLGMHPWCLVAGTQVKECVWSAGHAQHKIEGAVAHCYCTFPHHVFLSHWTLPCSLCQLWHWNLQGGWVCHVWTLAWSVCSGCHRIFLDFLGASHGRCTGIDDGQLLLVWQGESKSH